MRDLKYSKPIRILAIIHLIESILMGLFVFGMKEDFLTILKEDANMTATDLAGWEQFLNIPLLMIVVWTILSAFIILVLSYVLKKSSTSYITIIILSAISFLPTLLGIPIIVLSILNLVDAKKRNRIMR